MLAFSDVMWWSRGGGEHQDQEEDKQLLGVGLGLNLGGLVGANVGLGAGRKLLVEREE